MSKTHNISLLFFILAICLPISTAYAQDAGQALQFDGVDDYVEISNVSLSTNAITLESWVKHETLPDSVQRYVSVVEEVAVIRHDRLGTLHFYIKTDGILRHLNVSNALVTGQWYHVVGTWDGTTQRLYLNGAEIASQTPGGSLSTPSGLVRISEMGGEESMHGLIDEVRIWNYARTQEEIQADMNVTLTGNETGLAGYWRLDGNANDSSPYGNNGMVYGAQFVESDAPFGGAQNPTISGEITYPGNQVDFPNGRIFIPVWKNPSIWPFPPENEYPIVEEVINAPDLNYPVNYTIEVTDVAPGDWYYIAAFFDEDTTMLPQELEAEAWYGYDLNSGGINLDAGSVSGIDLELKPMGPPGGGFSFDFGATGGYAETDFQDLDGGPEITMEMFINVHSPYGPGRYYTLIARENWTFLEYDGDSGEFYFYLEGIDEIAWQHSPNQGEWHHLAAEYDGVNMTIYWDGEVKASIVTGGGNLPSAQPNMIFGDEFDGLVDIIRISDIALYKGNVFDPWTQDYRPNANTFLLYHCNEGGGNQLIDDSGNEHHATITGNPTWSSDEPLGFMGPSIWIAGVGPDYVDVNWDRWPDADPDFVRYELHRNNVGGVNLSDPVVLDETDINVISWRDNNVSEGTNYYYKLWMYDQGGIRYETNEVLATPGVAAEGRIAGVVSLNEDWAPGQVHLDLWFPGNDPEFDAPDLSQQWGEDPPFSVGYLFEDPGIYQGGPYNIRAYFDADNNGQFDEGEPKGGANDLYVPSSNELAPVDIELVSVSAGHVEGNISSNEAGSGRLFIGLFDPANGGDEWDPNFEISWNATFPSNQFYQFNDPAIYDAYGWNVRAFLDENSSGTPDGDEMRGESGPFQISGGIATGINIDLPRPGGPQIGVSTTQLNFTENVYTLGFQIGNEGPDSLYWEITIEYDSSGTLDWITSIEPVEGASGSSNEDTIVVTVMPTGKQEYAEIWIDGYSDPNYDNWIGDQFVEVYLDAWSLPAEPVITGSLEGITARENEDIVISVQIVAEAGLKRADVKYVTGGDPTIRTSSFTNTGGDNYEATIPASDVTKRGLIGFIEVEDEFNPPRITTSDTVEIRVDFDSLAILNTQTETYAMISVPGDLKDKNQMSVLDELWDYDKTQWRLFRWNGNNYSEFEGSATFEPGKAFWIITRNAVSLQGGSGKSTQLLPPYTINLNQGWNQIGTPYNFGNGVNDLEYTVGSIELSFYEYDGTGYRTVNMMDPGKGYWIYAYEATSIKFNLGGLGTTKLMVEGSPLPLDWGGRVKASIGSVCDSENIFGVIPSASSTWDEFDRHEPPVIGDYISLAFDNEEWDERGGIFSRDIRSNDTDGYVWTFVVRTNQEGYVHLNLEWMKSLPADWEIYLVDRGVNIARNLNGKPEYTFTSRGTGLPRHFDLVMGVPSFAREVIRDYEIIPEAYTLSQNFPNPFNAVTTIRFSLPEENIINLTIYDVLGHEIVNVVSNRYYNPGTHFILWDGKDKFGENVSTGVYFYRLNAIKDGVLKFQDAKKLILLK